MKTRGVAECFYSNKTRAAGFLNGLKKFSTKRVSLGSPNKGSICERGVIVSTQKKNKLCLCSILYIKNTNEECFIGI